MGPAGWLCRTPSYLPEPDGGQRGLPGGIGTLEGMVAVAERVRRARVVLWPLVLGLVIGVIGMHHLAVQHGASAPGQPGGHHVAAVAHDAEPAANPSPLVPVLGSSGVGHTVSPGPGGTAAEPAITSAEPTPEASPLAGASSTVPSELMDLHGSLSGAMLHLCMAILAGLVLLLLLGPVVLRGVWARADSAGSAAGAAALPQGAPPSPVPLRLAQLQVLRL